MSLPPGDIKLTHLRKIYPAVCARTPFYASAFGVAPGHIKIAPVDNPTVVIIARVVNDDYDEPALEFDEENAKIMARLDAE